MPTYVDIPIFSGQGTAPANTPATSARAICIASSSYGSLILSSCFSAFHAELSSLDPDDYSKADINPSDFDQSSSLLEVPPDQYLNNPIISSIRLVLIQTLTYLDFYAKPSCNTASEDTFKHECGVLGFSAGILSACVVAASHSTLDFINHATAAFRVAFWIGLRTQIYRRSVLESAGLPHEDPRPWSLVFVGLDARTAKEIMDDINAQQSELLALIMTAVIDESTVTISGRPDILASFADQVPSVTVYKTFVNTLYHAPMHACLRDEVVAAVIRRSIRFPTYSELRVPLLSTFTGETLSYPHGHGGTLAEVVIDLILTKPVNWDKVVQVTVRACKSLDGSVRLVNIGPGTGSELVKEIERALPPGHVVTYDPCLHLPAAADKENKVLHEPIAVVGMAVDMPGAPDVSHLWEVLEKGINTVTKIPGHRFQASDYISSKSSHAKRSMKAHTGNFVHDADAFDAKFFKISPREARSMDPQARILLHTAYEALEDAGYVPGSTPSFAPETFGCYIGAATSDYVQNLRDDIDVYYSTGTLRAFLSGRISYAMKLGGPSMVFDTACSGSLVAIHQACRALANGDCNAALAGGVNIITSPDMYLGLDRGHFLSPTGQCKAFDASADGYCRGEGCGIFVLKRAADAVAEGDNIFGIVRGVEINQSGLTHSITHPHVPTQTTLFRQLLSRSGIDAHRISVVEAHGTGTQAGDSAELESIRAVFGAGRSTENPLYITSIKANIGHLEAASGAASLAKLLLMLKHDAIPSQISLKNLNPRIKPLHLDHTIISTRQTAWKAATRRHPRVALLNNFGAAGSNGALLLEESISHEIDAVESSQSAYVVCLSAKDEDTLYRLRDSYVQWLRTSAVSGVSLADIAYTATARRIVYNYRLAVNASSKEDLAQRLDQAVGGLCTQAPRKVAFVFSGQGGQYKGMGSELYLSSPFFRKIIDECHSFLIKSGFPGILQIITSEVSGALESYADEFEAYQSAIVVLEYALAKLWMLWGLTPSIVIGHSLGEYAALVISGVLSLRDALTLVANRAHSMVTQCAVDSTGMLAINLGARAVQDILSSSSTFFDATVACYNSPADTVVAGPIATLKALKAHIDSSVKRKNILLSVPFGYHSNAMDPLLDNLVALGKRIVFHPTIIPIISNVTGEVVLPGTASFFTPEYLARHCSKPVLFEKGIASLQSHANLCDIGTWIEIGPHSTTLPMLSVHPSISKHAKLLPSLKRQRDAWVTLSAALAQIYTISNTIDWRNVFGHLNVHCTPLPAYPWSKMKFWVPFVDNIRDAAMSLHHSSMTRETTLAHNYSVLHTWVQLPSPENGFVAVFETPILQLADAICGHRISGYPVCPASIYHELALSGVKAAIAQLGFAFDDACVSLHNVSYAKALVYSCDDRRMVRTSVTISDNNSGTWSVGTRTNSEVDEVHSAGAFRQQSTTSTTTRLSPLLPGVVRRVNAVKSSQEAETFSARTVYKVIFPRVVDYSQEYHTVQSLVVSPNSMEGYAVIRLPVDQKGSQFVVHPVLMDTLLHVAGFLANMQCDTTEAFICNKVTVVEAIPNLVNLDACYGIYTSIAWSPTERTMLAEAFALELEGSSRIIAHLKGMHFREVRLSSLKRSLAAMVDKSSSLIAPLLRAPSMPAFHRTLSTPLVSPRFQASQVNFMEQVKRVIAKTCDISLANIDTSTDLAIYGVDSLMLIEISQELQKLFSMVDSSLALSSCRTGADITQEVVNALHSDSMLPSVLKHSVPPRPGSAPATEQAPSVRHLIAHALDMPVLELTDDADFCTLGLDSLSAIEIITEVQKLFAITLPHSVFESVKNVRELQTWISRSVPELNTYLAPSPMLPSPPSTPRKTPEVSTRRMIPGADNLDQVTRVLRLQEPLVHFQTTSDPAKTPLFLIHDGSGLVNHLKRVLPLHRALWGLNNPRFLDAGGWDSLQAMAAAYASHVLKVAGPVGPIMLGGWSFGGIVAFEAARQLLAKRVRVRGVLLIDSPCPTSHIPLSPELIAHAVRLGQRKFTGSDGTLSSSSSFERLVARQFEANARLLGAYSEELSAINDDSCPCPDVVLLRAREGFSPPGVEGVPSWLADPYEDLQSSADAWAELTGHAVKTIRVPGHHFALFDVENIAALSAAIVESSSYLESLSEQQ